LSGGGGGETASFLGASGMPAMPEGMSWSNFKSSLEAQMPQRVMGMNYQERFKVRNWNNWRVGGVRGVSGGI